MEKSSQDEIIDLLSYKANLKAHIYETTLSVFNELKAIGEETVLKAKKAISKTNKNIKIEYRDKSEFEAELRLAGDLLLLTMHTNIFEFPRDHEVMKTAYVKEDKNRSYCGVIYIYNFLADSIKYNRETDVGYLVARIYINKDKHFLVEGKRQIGPFYNNFIDEKLDRANLTSILNASIKYCVNFDLLTPPYELVKEISVQQIVDNNNYLKIKTGKRVGFRFQSDHDKFIK
ncbi:MAG: hypothetical protein PHT69_09595 [Bacteroidales bacterium]|nr:hypothetical protein [Bacteroidales bacterium]